MSNRENTPSAPLAARAIKLARRPLLVNCGSLLQRLPLRPLDLNCLYLLDRDGVPGAPARCLRGPALVRRATPRDLAGLTVCQDRPQAFLARFAAGDECAVAEIDGRIVAFQWYCLRPVYREERYGYRIELRPDTVYAYDIFIRPEHRLGGIWFKFHCLHLRRLMQEHGRRRIIGMVDYGNRISMNTHLSFGFQILRRVVVLRLLGKSLFFERTPPLGALPAPSWAVPAAAGSHAAAAIKAAGRR